ncbi:MAG: AAA family ATPase [Christensenellales bacterium]
MMKIKSIKFKNHPILKNLELDFCDANGNAADTVIIAGENGTGKSSLLNYLYSLSSTVVSAESIVMINDDNVDIPLMYSYDSKKERIWISDNRGLRTLPGLPELKEKYKMSGIFSDVDINFQADNLSSVTSMALDTSDSSRRSTTDLPKQIKQLLIDVQALDDAELSHAVRENPTKTKAELQVAERIPRFTNAFARMFDGLTYDRIDNAGGHKVIYFKKNGVDIPIDNLSSGEKQVVYRGCFLLKDVNATNGAFVFIDEPEISLHPSWQMKIMDYYKDIFTAEDGTQTSQIFAVTHSPFIIHNENRRNDKVIVLTRDENGDIIVKDKPEYFKCTSVEAVQDAFLLKSFSAEQPTVYLEGRTDEKYFSRVVQAFGMDVPFRFKWVGYMDEKGQEANTGDKSVDAAYQFLVARNLPIHNFCLKDCDTNRQPKKKNNVTILSIPPYKNAKGIKKGIENALVFDRIDLTPFYSLKTTTGEYGEKKEIQSFNKMACCDSICSMDDVALQEVFIHLKEMIDHLLALYNEG